MTRLRAQIAGLLIAAIVAVVALVTFAASRSLQPPPPESTVEPLARLIHAQIAFYATSREAAERSGVVHSATSPEGTVNAALSARISRAMAETGEAVAVRVIEADGGLIHRAAVELAPGNWLTIDIPRLGSPPGGSRLLFIWATGILIGSGAIALYAAWRVTRPLQLLDRAVEQIAGDGSLSPMPLTGGGEIRATAQAINRLAERLKAAMESRMRLVAAAGHDLRTPMTRMRLRAEFVQDPEERERWLADLEELDLIADSAIRLVREEVAQDSIEAFRADELMAEIVEELSPLGYRVALVEAQPLVLRAPRFAFKRAMRNIAVNGATHGGGAEIRLFSRQGAAVIEIADHGPGIPPELMDRVFEPFFRVDPARRKILPGAGLGLAIAREIVERAGARIEISANSPGGLMVRVVFDAPAGG